MKILLVIPSYQHAKQLRPLLARLQALNLPAVIINDGSDQENSAAIRSLVEEFRFTSLVEHTSNQGKGAAVLSGFRWGLENGFTHAFQIDSDGQHDPEAHAYFLRLATDNPDTLIAGYPVYDESIPLSRKIGRYATHIWVWIETLSFQIKDSMCGFRIYPLAPFSDENLIDGIGKRMDFDIEVMVRLYWRRQKILFSPVLVRYPKDGFSNFQGLRDNWMISKMHTRLFFGMLRRLPTLLWRKLADSELTSLDHATSKDPKAKSQHWARIHEKGSTIGISIAVWVMVHLNQFFLNLLMRCIAFYYTVAARSARHSSEWYRQRYYQFCKSQNLPYQEFSFLTHINACVDAIRDKFLVWSGRLNLDCFNGDELKAFEDLAKEQTGAVFISAHFGNIEIARALGRHNPHKKINALVYTDNAVKMNDALCNLNQDYSLNLISVAKFTPELAMAIAAKVEAGEWIFIMGDRQSLGQSANLSAKASAKGELKLRVIDSEATLAEGPFLMAYLLDCPTYSFFCYKKHGEYRISIEDIKPNLEKQKTNRRPFINHLADNYCRQLNQVICDSPTQWFNFYQFWNPS